MSTDFYSIQTALATKDLLPDNRLLKFFEENYEDWEEIMVILKHTKVKLKIVGSLLPTETGLIELIENF